MFDDVERVIAWLSNVRGWVRVTGFAFPDTTAVVSKCYLQWTIHASVAFRDVRIKSVLRQLFVLSWGPGERCASVPCFSIFALRIAVVRQESIALLVNQLSLPRLPVVTGKTIQTSTFSGIFAH